MALHWEKLLIFKILFSFFAPQGLIFCIFLWILASSVLGSLYPAMPQSGVKSLISTYYISNT